MKTIESTKIKFDAKDYRRIIGSVDNSNEIVSIISAIQEKNGNDWDVDDIKIKRVPKFFANNQPVVFRYEYTCKLVKDVDNENN